jgi:hypothetical protein
VGPDFTIGQGDTASILTDTLEDQDGNPVDISGATVAFKMRKLDATTPTVNAAASNKQNGDGTDGSKGKVSYTWGNVDTAVPGSYVGQWVVTYSSGKVQTFPNWTYISILITGKLA